MTYLRRVKLLTLAVTTAFLLSFSAVPAGAITIDFVTAGPIIQGQAFTIDVVVSGVDPLIDFEVLSFGFNYLAGMDATWSSLGQTVFADMDDSIASGLDVAGLNIPFTGPSGNDIVVASLDLMASAAGTYSFSIIGNPLLNANMGLFTAAMIYDMSHTEAFTVAPVPEPATMLLLGSGLIGMFGLKKKKLFRS